MVRHPHNLRAKFFAIERELAAHTLGYGGRIVRNMQTDTGRVAITHHLPNRMLCSYDALSFHAGCTDWQRKHVPNLLAQYIEPKGFLAQSP